MKTEKYTPERIVHLEEGQIFVFGSNLMGHHAGGAARIAYELFGAVWGEGVGLHGNSYAIPTMQGGIETIKPYVDSFIAFAKEHQELTFLVTRIGCGIAGFRDDEIAPLFTDAAEVSNIILPESFARIISSLDNGISTRNDVQKERLKQCRYYYGESWLRYTRQRTCAQSSGSL